MSAPTVVLAVISDLMFQSRVREHVRSLGYELALCDSADAVRAALEAGAGLVVLDLHVDDVDWRNAVALAQERRTPVLAFGRHTATELLRSAREAGCDRVVPRSTLVAELPQLIEELADAGQSAR